MNAAMQTMIAIFSSSGKLAGGGREEGSRGGLPDDPFALLLDRERERSGAHRGGQDRASVMALAQAFLMARPELDEAADLKGRLADLLAGDEADSLQVLQNGAEEGETSAEDAFMRALATFLGSDAMPAPNEAGDIDEENSPPDQAEDDEPAQPAEQDAHGEASPAGGQAELAMAANMPLSPDTSRREAAQSDRRADTGAATLRNGASPEGETIGRESSRAMPAELQQRTGQQGQPAPFDGIISRSSRTNANEPAGIRSFADAQPAQRVQFVSQQTVSSPMPIQQMPLTMTGQSVLQGIESANRMRPVQADIATMLSQRHAQAGTTSLKIQLQPVELGTVTARLTTTGTQLSIELQVETSDARQRLSSESDAIMKAMRAIGYDVDRVTIQQSANGANQAANGQQSAGGRDFAGSQQQSGSDENGRGGSDRNGHSRGEHHGGNGNEPAQKRSDGGIYI